MAILIPVHHEQFLGRNRRIGRDRIANENSKKKNRNWRDTAGVVLMKPIQVIFRECQCPKVGAFVNLLVSNRRN